MHPGWLWWCLGAREGRESPDIQTLNLKQRQPWKQSSQESKKLVITKISAKISKISTRSEAKNGDTTWQSKKVRGFVGPQSQITKTISQKVKVSNKSETAVSKHLKIWDLLLKPENPINPPNHPDQILSLATLNKNFRAEAATWAKWSGCGKPTTGTAAKPVLNGCSFQTWCFADPWYQNRDNNMA